MNIALSCLFVLATASGIYADPEPQYGYRYPFGYPAVPYSPNYGGFPVQQQQPNYFRAGLPQPSIENQSPENRLFFGTVTITVGTTTTTLIQTLSTTCTTSTAAISICSPSGRRRRGLSINGDKKVRGLFYNDNNEEELDDSGVFIRKQLETEGGETKVEKINERDARAASADPAVPFVVQPGFNAPDGVRGARFLVALATYTTTSTSTTTYQVILTAMCKSTTAFSPCTGTGK